MIHQIVPFDPATADPFPISGSWISWDLPLSRAQRAWRWMRRVVLRRPADAFASCGFARIVSVSAGGRILIVERATAPVPKGAKLYFSRFHRNAEVRRG